MAKKSPNTLESDEESIEPEKSLFVKISDATNNIIQKYSEAGKTKKAIIEQSIIAFNVYESLPQDIRESIENLKLEFGTEAKVIEEAIKLLNTQQNPELGNDRDLWCESRKMGMMLIGRTTFKQMIHAAGDEESRLDRPQQKNNALDVILWYTKKAVTTLTLLEVLNAIQKMWVVSNYFDHIEINQDGATYHLMLKHSQNQRYSDYWLGYFKNLFEYLNSWDIVPFKCKFNGQSLLQTVSLTIDELYEKNNNK